jgi:hypothetical protein
VLSPLYLLFQAGITITSIVRESTGATITFGAPAGGVHVMEYSSAIASPTGWTPISGTIVGDDHFVSLTDDDPDRWARYYRVRQLTP